MDHNVYENQMIDGVNRNAEEKNHHTSTQEEPVVATASLFTKTDATALKRGIKILLVALLTAAQFALAVFCFIKVATTTGYWAVILFLGAILLLVWAFVFLYALGIIPGGRQGEGK